MMMAVQRGKKELTSTVHITPCMHAGSSPSPSLAVIYGVSLVGVLVVAVVAVVMTILCYKRQENAKRYYTFASRLTIEPREGNIRSLLNQRKKWHLYQLFCPQVQ